LRLLALAGVNLQYLFISFHCIFSVMVRAMIVSVALALASADEQASLLQTQTSRNAGKGSQTLKDADVLTLLDTLIAHPQSTAEELVGAEPSVQQALVQRANEKPRRLQILDRVLGLPTSKKLELLQAAKTSPEVGRLFNSLSQQTHLNLIEMAKADSVDVAMEPKDGEWWDMSAKSAKVQCDGGDYFGDISGTVSVVDPDIGLVGVNGRVVDPDVGTMDSQGYCDTVPSLVGKRCTYIHYTGPTSSCVKPAPPDYCHRYHKVTYSKCDALDALGGISAAIDADVKFDTDGVLKDCKDFVTKNEVYCWGPPNDDAQQCSCPTDDATTTAAPEPVTTAAPEPVTTAAPEPVVVTTTANPAR